MKLDHLSPPITFYYNGYNAHVSVTSGILNIISYLIIISFIIYFLSIIIERKDPRTFYFNYFTEDAGTFYLNSSTLFHFINIEKKSRFNENIGFDFLKFRVLGLNRTFESYLYSRDITHFDHQLYGKCKNDNYTKTIDGLNDYNFFGDSACIIKFFNHHEGKYYGVGEPGFEWPKIAHGINNQNNSIYNIIISRCKDETLNEILGERYKCDNDTEFKNFFNEEIPKVLNFYFKDNIVNIKNYENPYSEYFFKIENLLNMNTLSSNTLNFNPAVVKTNDGFIHDNIKNNISCIFNRNDEIKDERRSLDGYVGYRFSLKNMGYYYERNYEKFADFISSIGGVYSAVKIIFYYINLYINKFVSINDLEKTLGSPKNNENIKNENSRIKYIKEDFKINYSFNKSFSKRNIIELNSFSERSKKLDKTGNSNYNDNNSMDYKEEKNVDNYKFSNTWEKNNEKDININIGEFGRDKIKSEDDLNFWTYNLYLIACRKRKNLCEIYDSFRIKILSEEKLIQSYLDICNLLKATEKMIFFKKNNIYNRTDLLKLI